MKILIIGFLLSGLSVSAEAKVLFEGKTQDAAAIEVVLKENLFGKQTLQFKNQKLKVASVDGNVSVANLQKDPKFGQMILITGTNEEVDSGMARVFWGQGWNENMLRLKLGMLILAGECDTAQGIFKGIIFEFTQPDDLGTVACLK